MSKYFKQPNYRLVIKYDDGQIWDVPAFTYHLIDQKRRPELLNNFWGSEEEWDSISDNTEIFPPQRDPQITI